LTARLRVPLYRFSVESRKSEMPFDVGIHHEPNASHGIGSDSQRPSVIVGGLVGALAINVFLLPTLYVFVPTTIALAASVPQGPIAVRAADVPERVLLSPY
jgi:hypothetical protein